MVDPQRIWSSSQLPTLPAVAARLLEVVKNPESSIDDVVDVIRSDPALSAKLIKSANSSYFGVRSHIKTIDRAVPLLGTSIATSLALSFALTDDSMKAGSARAHYRAFWKQSIVQAAAAELLAARVSGQDPAEYFFVGLMLDIGRLAMLKTIPTQYRSLLDRKCDPPQTLIASEMQSLGFGHATIGARLLEQWQIPSEVVLAVEQHETNLSDLSQMRNHEQFRLITTAALAGAVGEYFCCDAKGQALERMQQISSEYFDFEPGELDRFLADCEGRIRSVGCLLNVDVADIGSSAELTLQANEQLVNLSLQMHAVTTQVQQQHEALTKEKSRLEQHNRALHEQAMHDGLTGLHNRKFFDEALASEANRCQRQATPLAALMIDVDHFKSLNDTHGHPFGDAILQQMAQRLRGAVRTSDVLARYGGEEFVVLVSQPTEKGITTLSERIRCEVADRPFVVGDVSVNVTCSLGASIAIPGRRDRNVGERLIAAADQSLYAAKHAGRNQSRISSLISEEDRRLHQRVTSNRFSRWLVQRNLVDLAGVSRALLECPLPLQRIGELAVELRYMTAEQVDCVLKCQEPSDERFGAIAIRLGLLTSDQLVTLLALQHEDPHALGTAIIRLGLLGPDEVAGALESYLSTYASAATVEAIGV